MTILQNVVLRKSQLVFGAVAGIQELKSKRLQKKCRALAERENPLRIMEFTNFLNCGHHHLFVLRKVEKNIPHTAMPDAKAFAAYSALFDHGLASKSDQRFASIRSTGNLTFSTAF